MYFKTSRKLSLVASLFNRNDVYDSFKLHRYKGNLSNLLKTLNKLKSNKLVSKVLKVKMANSLHSKFVHAKNANSINFNLEKKNLI